MSTELTLTRDHRLSTATREVFEPPAMQASTERMPEQRCCETRIPEISLRVRRVCSVIADTFEIDVVHRVKPCHFDPTLNVHAQREHVLTLCISSRAA